jgi:small-conductance mechanosensitive channel/CRP-like cAMP-binding protein
MADITIATLSHHLLQPWHPDYLQALVACAIFLALLTRRGVDNAGIVRSTLILLILMGVIGLGSGFTSFFGMPRAAEVMDAIVMLMVGMLVIRLAGLTLFRVALIRTGLHPPRILEDIVIVLGYIAWGMVRLRYAGLDLSGMVTTSAVITAIIAFSMQDTLGNILGGLALQLDNSITIGDWIKVDDVSGRVIEVHWRHTAVRTRNGEVVVLPNSLLMKGKFTIVGSADVSQWRRWVNFQVSNTASPQRVIDAVESALGQADIALVSKHPAPSCVAMNFREGLVDYSVRYWLTNPLQDDPTDSQVRIHIYAALQRNGFKLAPPQLAIDLTTESSERDQAERAKELALRKRTLKKIELFSGFSDDELGEIAGTLTFATFARGDVITRQGAIAHWLYILISGEADVWFEAATHQRRHLTTLPTGRVFGEMGLMTGEARRATVTARTDAECYRLDKKSFEHIVQSRPELADVFAHILTERNKQLVAVQNDSPSVNHEEQKARILASIKKFFRLDNGR